MLLVTCAQHGNANAADWAVLVLPVIEGAIQFQMVGAIATWGAIAAGYAGLDTRAVRTTCRRRPSRSGS